MCPLKVFAFATDSLRLLLGSGKKHVGILHQEQSGPEPLNDLLSFYIQHHRRHLKGNFFIKYFLPCFPMIFGKFLKLVQYLVMQPVPVGNVKVRQLRVLVFATDRLNLLF